MAGIRILEERRKFQALDLVYKCIHKKAPRYVFMYAFIYVCMHLYTAHITTQFHGGLQFFYWVRANFSL